MKQDYFFGLDIVYIAATIFFIIMVVYLFRISRNKRKK